MGWMGEGGVCMCAWDRAYVWREMGEGGWGVCMCAWDSVYIWREMGEGGVCPSDLPRSRPLVRVALPAILFARPFPFTPAYPVFSTGSLACTGNRSCDMLGSYLGCGWWMGRDDPQNTHTGTSAHIQDVEQSGEILMWF